MTLTLTVETSGRTHTGLVRRRNEDGLYVGRHLVAVADGLGGHVAGDVASSTVIDTVQAFDRPTAPGDLIGALGRAVGNANAALRRRIAAEPEVAGMGTTLVALTWSGTTAALAHVGDSRAYRLRDGRTVRLTEDHIYEHLVADAELMATLPARLSRYLDGRTDGRSADVTSHDLRAGDRYLLCSDGLSSFVSHDLIHSTLASYGSADEIADRLVGMALDAGGHDNVTVAVIQVREEPA
jgi:protein phosphatase